MDLGDIGDPTAPVGSKPWVRACAYQAQTRLKDARSEIAHLKIKLRDLRDNNYFRLLENRKGKLFDSWEQFCKEDIPWGLGITREKADRLITADPRQLLGEFEAEQTAALVEIVPAAKTMSEAGSMKGKALAHELKLPTSSVNPERIAARINRDHPDIADRAKAGEFTSARQMGIAAGIVKPKPSVMLGNPEQVARRIYEHGHEFAMRVDEHLDSLINGSGSGSQ